VLAAVVSTFWSLLFSKVGRAASVAFDGRRPSCLENLRAAGHKISKNTYPKMSFFVDKFVKNVYNIVKRIRRCGT